MSGRRSILTPAPGPIGGKFGWRAQLRAFEHLAPDFRSLHPLDANSPQECSEITAHVFRSLRFDTNYQIPTYRAWLDADVERHLPAYRFHKRFLQHLQSQDRATGAAGRWVLKCPEHLFALRAIRTVYPDARLVFVHRDPVRVLLSQTRPTEVLRKPFTRRLDRDRIGQDESARWLAGARRMVEVGDDAGLPDPVCHVHHMDLIADPVATVDAGVSPFRRGTARVRRGGHRTLCRPRIRTAAMAVTTTGCPITASIPGRSGPGSGPTLRFGITAEEAGLIRARTAIRRTRPRRWNRCAARAFSS